MNKSNIAVAKLKNESPFNIDFDNINLQILITLIIDY